MNITARYEKEFIISFACFIYRLVYISTSTLTAVLSVKCKNYEKVPNDFSLQKKLVHDYFSQLHIKGIYLQRRSYFQDAFNRIDKTHELSRDLQPEIVIEVVGVKGVWIIVELNEKRIDGQVMPALEQLQNQTQMGCSSRLR